MSKGNNSAAENKIIKAAAKDTSALATFAQPVPILSSITSMLKSDDNTPNKGTQSGSFVDILYKHINSAI